MPQEPSLIGSIKIDNGIWCDTNEQILDTLLNALFPGSETLNADLYVTTNVVIPEVI